MNLRLIYFGGLMLCLTACKTQEKTSTTKGQQGTTITNCPEGGNCSFEILKNKTLEVKTDGIGAKYPQLREGQKTVLKLEYKKKSNPELADDGYREIIYAEIDSATTTLELKDNDLQQAKVLFGRLCFCRGQTGYYSAKKGSFNITTDKNGSTTYNFNLKISEVPQLFEDVSVINY
jgi:hypothetical protein